MELDNAESRVETAIALNGEDAWIFHDTDRGSVDDIFSTANRGAIVAKTAWPFSWPRARGAVDAAHRNYHRALKTLQDLQSVGPQPSPASAEPAVPEPPPAEPAELTRQPKLASIRKLAAPVATPPAPSDSSPGPLSPDPGPASAATPLPLSGSLNL